MAKLTKAQAKAHQEVISRGSEGPVQREQATVFRGGGRRWLTLRAACNAEARALVRKRYCDCDPHSTCDYHKGDERLLAIRRRLTRRYLTAAQSAPLNMKGDEG